MPKSKKSESVLYNWVHELSFQQQALLLTAMRGPDQNNKHNAAKCIVRYLRGIVIKPAGNWHGENDNDFMWGEYDYFKKYMKEFWNDHDEYPHHFIMHLVHCAEVVGYKYLDPYVKNLWHEFYLKACESFHMEPESESQMDARLNDFGVGIHNE